MTTRTTPPLQLEDAQGIVTALGRDLLAQDHDVPDHDDLTNAAASKPGRDWLYQVAGEIDDLTSTFHRLHPLTARRILTSLCTDLHDRQVPTEHAERHFTLQLENSAQDMRPAEWLAAAGEAWAAALAADARADADD